MTCFNPPEIVDLTVMRDGGSGDDVNPDLITNILYQLTGQLEEYAEQSHVALDWTTVRVATFIGSDNHYWAKMSADVLP